MIIAQLGGTGKYQSYPQTTHFRIPTNLHSSSIKARADHKMRAHLMETLESMFVHANIYVSQYASMQEQMNVLNVEHIDVLIASLELNEVQQLWSDALKDCDRKFQLWTQHCTHIQDALNHIDRRRTKNSSLEQIIQQLKEAEIAIQNGILLESLERQYQVIQLEINSWVNKNY